MLERKVSYAVHNKRVHVRVLLGYVHILRPLGLMPPLGTLCGILDRIDDRLVIRVRPGDAGAHCYPVHVSTRREHRGDYAVLRISTVLLRSAGIWPTKVAWKREGDDFILEILEYDDKPPISKRHV